MARNLFMVPMGQPAKRDWFRTSEYEVQSNAKQSVEFEAVKEAIEGSMREEQGTVQTPEAAPIGTPVTPAEVTAEATTPAEAAATKVRTEGQEGSEIRITD